MQPSPQLWRQAVIRCTPGYEDIISALLFDAGCSGIVEKRDNEATILVASFDASGVIDPINAFKYSLSSLPYDVNGIVDVTAVTDVPLDDWETSWREGLTAVESGSRLVIHPSWVPYENTDGRIEIIIDPKMAFGTGHHATTALCLEQLERLDIAGKRIIDAGIGSGVLAIAAVKLGATVAHGFDHDEWSVANARENAVINGVADRIRIDHASLADWQADPSPVVFANMISGVLVPHLPRFRSLLEPDGCIVFSGLLDEEESMFTTAARDNGFGIDQITCRDEWIAVRAHLDS